MLITAVERVSTKSFTCAHNLRTNSPSKEVYDYIEESVLSSDTSEETQNLPHHHAGTSTTNESVIILF